MSTAKTLIDHEAFRLLDMLQERDPGDGSYGTILTNIEHLLGVRQFAIDVLADSEVKGPEEHYPMLVHNVEEKTEAAPVDAAPVETKTYTKEEVRAALGAARKTGLNVAEFLQGMGFANFTAVPAAEYPKIMEAIQHGA